MFEDKTEAVAAGNGTKIITSLNIYCQIKLEDVVKLLLLLER